MKVQEALLVIDIQNGVCRGAQKAANLAQLIELVNQRILAYQAEEKLIIYIQHCDQELIEGSYPWEIIPEITQVVEGIFLNKTHANSFLGTDLKAILDQAHVTSLEICGAQTEYCVDTTIKFAHGLGYQLVVGKGMTTTLTNKYLSASETIAFYEEIWHQRFAEVYD